MFLGQVLLQLSEHRRRQRLALLGILGNHLDFLNRVPRDILSLDEKRSQGGTPTTIVIPGSTADLSVKVEPIEEIADERSVELVNVLRRQHELPNVLSEHIEP